MIKVFSSYLAAAVKKSDCHEFTVLYCLLFFSVAIRCSWLSDPKNGKIQRNRNSFGSTVRFSCSPGYNLVGSTERTCQITGKWTGTHPMCYGEALNNLIILFNEFLQYL